MSKRPSLPKIEIKFVFDGERHTATLSRHNDNTLAAIDLDGGADNASIGRLVSLLLHYGADLQIIRRAVDGRPMAVVLDRLMGTPETSDKESH
jgi:hypothetical protein